MSSKINRYIQRLCIEYKKQDITLFNILKELRSDDIKIKTHNEVEESCNSMGDFFMESYHAHTLVFLLPKECFENGISISNQETASNKIKQDLNQIVSESNEYIKEVKFELKDEIDAKTYLKEKTMSAEMPDFWDKNCLRVFVSHSKNYSFVKKLKDRLMYSGVSCFVAHKDIEPTKKWQREIMEALKSMEMMFCLITKDSCKSWWVNQEIGFALARGIPIIPIKLDGYDPKGFINEIQAMSLNINNIESSANDLVRVIIKRFSQYPPVKKHFLNKFLEAKDGSFFGAKQKFMNIINLEFNDQEVEEIVKTIEGPASTIVNQLMVLLSDRIIQEHLIQLQDKEYKYYAELLNDKVLSQHTQKRYSIKNSNGNSNFKIIDSQEKIVRNQKTSKPRAEKHNQRGKK